MSRKKIEVYTSGHEAPLDLSMRPLEKWPLAATLVVHEGKEHEPVFTQSEVRTILKNTLREVFSAMQNNAR